MRFKWTPETIARAADLWSQKLSMGEISNRMSVSRNSVASMMNRHRDQFPKVGVTRKPAEPKKVKKTNWGSTGRADSVPKPRVDPPDYRNLDPQTHGLPGVEPVRFVDLVSGQCKYPLQAFAAVGGPDMLCCGATTNGEGPYCAPHRIRATARPAAYQPRKTKAYR